VSRIVHLHGGSVLLDHVAAAGIAGDALEWCDVLVFGPTPPVSGEAWYDARARALEELRGQPGPYRQRLIEQDRALATAAADDAAELVLWFGPELFCQTILLALLARLHGRPRVALISPGDLPGKPRGCTVSHLSADELQAAFAVRAAVTPAQTELATRAWDAWRARDQRAALTALLARDLSPLPHLGAAVERWLEEPFQTDRLIDAALARGRRDWRALFHEVQAAEPRPWLTDELFLYRLAKRGLPPDSNGRTAAPKG
jgi:hypothetical protein